MSAKGNDNDAASRLDPDILRNILRAFRDVIVVLDEKGNVRFVTASVVEVTGYSVEELADVEDFGRLLFPDPEERDRLRVLWRQDAAQVNPPERILLATTKSGDKRWLRFLLAGTHDGFTIASIHDVTDRKIIEDRYRALFAQAPDSVFLIDSATAKIVDVNDYASEVFGFSRTEFLSLGLKDLELVESDAEIARHGRMILKNGSDKFESKWKTKAGDTRDVFVNCRRLMIGVNPYFQTVVHDLTERKRTETALMESEESFRNLAEQSPSMIFINSNRRILFANHQCEEVMEYSRRELYAAEFNFMVLVAPEHHEMTVKAFQKHKSGREVDPYEYVLVTKSGRRIESMISTKLITYRGEKSILGVVTDISNLKRTEAELRKSEILLTEQKKALQEKNAALKEVLAQIEAEKLQIRNEVAANIESLAMPILEKLKKARASDQGKYVDLLANALGAITSKFGIKMSKGMTSLSPAQIEICNMIKNGMTSKEIADLLHISLRTVETQRNRLRKKLGISGEGSNLVAYLRAMD